jgi:mannose-6-phosphate isomerase-like protein (cupin superfamily)
MNDVSRDGSRAVISQADDLTWFDTMPGEQMAMRVHSTDVDGAFTIVEARVPAYTGPPLHYHEEREEIFEILEGRFRFHCAGDEFEAGPGTSVVIPRNQVHGWVNLGPGPARLLFTFVPGGIDDFFPLIGQTPPAEWHALGQRHDIWTVGAPMVADQRGAAGAEQQVP